MRRHRCSARCNYNLYGQCSFTGAYHRCTDKCLVEGKDGEMVCTWTGIVGQGIGGRVERGRVANQPRRQDQEQGGRGRIATGYRAPARKQIAVGPGPGNAGGRRGILPGGAPDTKASRHFHTAIKIVDTLLFKSNLREQLQRATRAKRTHCFRCMLRSVPKPQSLMDVTRCWESSVRQHAGLVLCHADGSQQKQLQQSCVQFLVAGWLRLCTTRLWSDPRKRPDFESFVMGLLYMCRDGVELDGFPLVPHVPFFYAHLPDISELTLLHQLLQQRDCRASCIGRRRIMEGHNAINSAAIAESDIRAVADFAVEFQRQSPGQLLMNYVPIHSSQEPYTGVGI